MTNINLKSGGLSSYGLNCGYVQNFDLGDKGRVSLYKECGTFHVNWFIGNSHLWRTFDNLKESRGYWSLVKKNIKSQTEVNY